MHAAICDFMVDCLQNSVEAGADLIQLELKQEEALVTVSIRDNGCGMDPEELKRAQDPFYTDGTKHAARKVGLGIPFLKQAVDLAEGRFELRSEKGRGTFLEFGFDGNNLDAPPLGRVDRAFLQILLFGGGHEIIIRRSCRKNGRTEEYELKRSELLEVLGGLEDSDSLILARDYLENQEESVRQI